MKIYTTITTERAEKSQGGNKFCNIDILVGSKTNQISGGQIQIRIDENDDNIFFIDYLNDDKTIKELAIINTKGKRQKDELRLQLKEDREKDSFNSGMQQ